MILKQKKLKEYWMNWTMIILQDSDCWWTATWESSADNNYLNSNYGETNYTDHNPSCSHCSHSSESLVNSRSNDPSNVRLFLLSLARNHILQLKCLHFLCLWDCRAFRSWPWQLWKLERTKRHSWNWTSNSQSATCSIRLLGHGRRIPHCDRGLSPHNIWSTLAECISLCLELVFQRYWYLLWSCNSYSSIQNEWLDFTWRSNRQDICWCSAQKPIYEFVDLL